LIVMAEPGAPTGRLAFSLVVAEMAPAPSDPDLATARSEVRRVVVEHFIGAACGFRDQRSSTAGSWQKH
jgi:hypothetical protein